MGLTKSEKREVQRVVEEKLSDEVDGLRENLQAINENMDEIQEAAKAGDAVADLKEKVASRSEENAEHIDSIQETLDNLEEDFTERQDEFEARMKAGGMGSGISDAVWTPGRSLAENVQERELSSQDSGITVYAKFDSWNWREWRKAQRKEITPATSSGGDLTDRDTIPGIIGPGERTLTIRDLIPTNTTNTDLVRFVQENTVTDNAGPQDVSAGAAKGESDFTFDDATAPVETLAHWVKVSTQLLDDVQRLQNYLNNRMRFLLLQEEEDLQAAGWTVVPFAMADEQARPSPWDRFFVRARDYRRPRLDAAALGDALSLIWNREAAARLDALLTEVRPRDRGDRTRGNAAPTHPPANAGDDLHADLRQPRFDHGGHDHWDPSATDDGARRGVEPA